MSGHSRWAQIKRQKGAADAKRGTLYTRLSNMISAAVQTGGKDPSMNVRLRLLVEKGRSVNMPSATIERAIRRGAGELPGGRIEQICYECFGPCGVACIIEAVTDNKNRATSEIRHILSKHSCRLGTTGSVLWMFETKGTIGVSPLPPGGDAELTLIDAGAEDIRPIGERAIITTKPESLESVKASAEQLGLRTLDPEIVFIPKNESRVVCDDEKALHAFLSDLEQCNDVTNVTTNAKESADSRS
jgi:YebC/PmpR family DNA-binding regulatory protein